MERFAQADVSHYIPLITSLLLWRHLLFQNLFCGSCEYSVGGRYEGGCSAFVVIYGLSDYHVYLISTLHLVNPSINLPNIVCVCVLMEENVLKFRYYRKLPVAYYFDLRYTISI